jgi:hypothetical protein
MDPETSIDKLHRFQGRMLELRNYETLPAQVESQLDSILKQEERERELKELSNVKSTRIQSGRESRQ